MVKTAYPFAATPIVDDVSWRRMARLWLVTGVVAPAQVSAPAYAPAMLAFGDGSGLNVKIEPGEAYVDGGYFAQDARQTLPINPPDASNARIDRVVLRWDGPLNTADYVVLQGTPAAIPAPPAPTQNAGGRWDLPLAQVRVTPGATNIAASAVTDERTFAVARGTDAQQRNQLTNGGFEIGQRGAGPFAAANAWTADRWQLQPSISTGSVTLVAPGPLGGGSILQCVYTHSPNGLVNIVQPLENWSELRGRTLSLTARVLVPTGSPLQCSLQIFDGVTATYSPVAANSGAWQTLTVTATIAANATQVLIALGHGGASGTAQWDDAMLVPGAIPARYVPLSPAEEWERCQRYRQTVQVHARFKAAAALDRLAVPVAWRVRPAVAPTITVTTNTGVNLAVNPVVDTVTTDGARMEIQAAAAGDTFATGVIIVADSNP